MQGPAAARGGGEGRGGFDSSEPRGVERVAARAVSRRAAGRAVQRVGAQEEVGERGEVVIAWVPSGEGGGGGVCWGGVMMRMVWETCGVELRTGTCGRGGGKGSEGCVDLWGGCAWGDWMCGLWHGMCVGAGVACSKWMEVGGCGCKDVLSPCLLPCSEHCEAGAPTRGRRQGSVGASSSAAALDVAPGWWPTRTGQQAMDSQCSRCAAHRKRHLS